MRLLGVVIALALAWSTPVAAQDDALHLVWPSEGGASELWARRVARRLADEGADARTDDEWARTRGAELGEAHAALVRVESGLAAARAAMRAFDERAALEALATAREDAMRALVLPGAVAWAAEVELAIGRVAAHAGLVDLARASFAHAFALAPSRALGAAEAAPDVVALANEVMSETTAAPMSRFDVALATDAPAVVFLDDRALGRAPRRVETRAGTHVLRVEAEGAEPYVAWLDVLPGTRAPLTITPSPTALLAALASARRALAGAADDELPHRIAAIEALLGRRVVVWQVEAGTGPLDRAIAIACDAERCHAPARLETQSRDSPRASLSEPELAPRSLRAARAWRDESLPIEAPPPPPTDSWSEAWPWALVGTGAALVIGGVIAGIVVATEPPPEHRLVIDPTFRP